MKIQTKNICFFLCLISMYGAQAASFNSFNVMDFGVRGDGKTDDSKAFIEAWTAACRSNGSRAKILVPKATYLVGPMLFIGPCKPSIYFKMEGYLEAPTDLAIFAGLDRWVEFNHIDQLTIVGGVTLDGQGSVDWRFNECPKHAHCNVLPLSLKFAGTNNTVVRGLTSLNSKFFHIGVVGCTNFTGTDIRIRAPGNSPNTDGIHIEESSGVSISNAIIGTGDDCISIGPGNSQISISGITCGPGHGISVGSLGKYKYEKDVTGLIVQNSKFIGTMNGIRIKTWSNSPVTIAASNMTFRNLVMKNVQNPIKIDQVYCPFVSCDNTVPSSVKLSDISFHNIRGSSATEVAVSLRCSRGFPCENVKLHEVHLNYNNHMGHKSISQCEYVKAVYSGTQIPPPCKNTPNY